MRVPSRCTGCDCLGTSTASLTAVCCGMFPVTNGVGAPESLFALLDSIIHSVLIADSISLSDGGCSLQFG
jgi:hypothetical protein